ncbi:MAG: hypothetical protein R2909_06545 [Gemmatimonadales bacterium]
MTRPTLPRGQLLTPLGWAALAALAAGLGESAVAMLAQLGRGRVSLFGPEAVWLRPLAELLVMAPIAALFVLGWGLIRPLRTAGAAIVCFGGLAGFAVLSGIEGLHWASALLLGVGTAAVLARSDRFRRLRPWRAAHALVGGGARLGIAEPAAGMASRRSAKVAGAVARAGAPNVLLLVLDTARAWNLGGSATAEPPRRRSIAGSRPERCSPKPWRRRPGPFRPTRASSRGARRRSSRPVG